MKKRISFWGIIFLITALLGALDIKMYYDGHDIKGKIRSYLLPIVESYNKLDLVKSSNKLAKVKGDRIVIEDVNSNKYEYVYSEENGKEILTNEYISSNSINGQIIAKNMIEAVSKHNGSTELIFSEYDFSTFEKTTIENGAVITTGSAIKVKIGTKKNILASIREARIPKANNSGETSNSNLIGNWYLYEDNAKKESYLQLNEDNSGVFNMDDMNQNITYSYTDTEITLNFTELGISSISQYTLNGNTLTTVEDGETSIFMKN